MMEREKKKSMPTGCLLTPTCALWHEHMPYPTNTTDYNVLVPILKLRKQILDIYAFLYIP